MWCRERMVNVQYSSRRWIRVGWVQLIHSLAMPAAPLSSSSPFSSSSKMFSFFLQNSFMIVTRHPWLPEVGWPSQSCVFNGCQVLFGKFIVRFLTQIANTEDKCSAFHNSQMSPHGVMAHTNFIFTVLIWLLVIYKSSCQVQILVIGEFLSMGWIGYLTLTLYVRLCGCTWEMEL